jgi:hypothetical protein
MLQLLLPLSLALTVPWLDPSAVSPGQRGVCVTEWSGGERREIPVEVLGMLDAEGPERTLVLVRLLDERLAGSGVVAGMSGSPVYIGDRLLGAIAYGWAFAREPLAAVTPFALMRKLSAGGAPPIGASADVTVLAGLAAGSVAPREVLPALPVRSAGTPHLLAVAGLPIPEGIGRDVLTALGLQPAPAGTTALEGTPEAGDPLAALLVWGDATLAASGTVTARDGDHVFAFGHPLFALGSVRMPAARACVLAVQTSYMDSFKIMSIGRSFGTVVADRPAGVLALAGESPRGVPVTVTVNDATGRATWRFAIAEVPLLQPLLATYLAHACLTARGAAQGEASVRALFTTRFADGRTLSVAEATRGTDALARISAFAGGLLGALVNTSFPHPALAAFEATLERDERATGATLQAALPSRTVIAPGDALDVTVNLEPHERALTTERLTLKIPDDTTPGAVDLVVADGATWSAYRAHVDGVTPVDFDGLLAQIARLETSATLVAALEAHERGLALPGASLPALPPSWLLTLSTGLGGRGFARLTTVVVATARIRENLPLAGFVRVPLTVRPRMEVP